MDPEQTDQSAGARIVNIVAEDHESILGSEPLPDVAGSPGRTTRRTVLKWAAIGGVAASGALGRLVGFTATAAQAANDYECKTILRCEFSCYGTCEPFESSCRMNLAGNKFCICRCAAGPYNCRPATFRAHATCSTNSYCCCSTCV